MSLRNTAKQQHTRPKGTSKGTLYTTMAVFWWGEFVGCPTACLVVVLDNVPKAMGEIKLNRDERVVVVHKVSLFVSFRHEYCCFEVFLGDVAFPSSVQWYSCLEDFFCSGHHREVRFNVTIQRIVAGLDLSLLVFLA